MVAAIIQARVGSSRLPGKVLREVNGLPLLHYMMERVRAAKNVQTTAIATTDKEQDKPIVDFCLKKGFNCFCGNEEDVLDRYYQCARNLRAQTIVRLTSDCPLIDPHVIDEVVEFFRSHHYDYVGNTVPPVGTFPDGMDVEVFSFDALQKAWREARKPSEREHVTFYLWQNPNLFRTARYDQKNNMSEYRLTIDYPEDLEVIQSILGGLYGVNPQFSMHDIIRFLEQNPGIRSKNEFRKSNQGWETAFKKDRNAGF